MKKVLLATNSEFGQSNVFLAAGHALQSLDADVEIHFASFAGISGSVSAASQYSVRCSRGARPWTFHELAGPHYFAAITSEGRYGDHLWDVLGRRPSFFNTIEVLKMTMTLMLPWSAPEFIQVHQSLVQVVEQIQPDVIVVDSLFSPALTACRSLNVKHVVLSPNTLKDFSAALQPWGAMFWKFPVMGAGLEFPVPWLWIPANIFYCLCVIWFTVMDRTTRAMAAEIKRELGADVVTFASLMMNPPANTKILVANRAEIDFPLVVPQHLTPCGPLIRPVPPVSEVDPELDAWLQRGPTVFISLGTLMVMTEDEATEFAGALQHVLEAAEGHKGGEIGQVPGKLQVLWKLKKSTTSADYGIDPGTKIYGILGEWLKIDQVRIVDWVRPEPSAVLQAGTVVCSVNHGGANSFNDALTSEIPQICLPPWLDCYDFGSRVEVLGIGRWGNKKAMPRWSKEELGPILVDVVLSPNAASMRSTVRELAAICNKTPGSEVAAAAILEEIDGKKNK